MLKSTIPYFLISIFLLSVLDSCVTTNVVKDFSTCNLNQSHLVVGYFSDPNVDYVYKANITVYGHELTGIFIAKKINDTTHRVVFTTEFGNKLLDVEISETDFKINAIVAELDRALLLKVLRADFRLLFKERYTLTEQFENTNQIVYKSTNGSQFDYLFISKKERKLLKIIQASRRKEKINLSFTAENNIFAESCIIEQYAIPLRITLTRFKT